MHAAPITIAKAKTPIAIIEPAIMMNQAHMTATDAQPTIGSAAQWGKTPKVRKVECIAAIDDVAFRSPIQIPPRGYEASAGFGPSGDLLVARCHCNPKFRVGPRN
jgi:hypothetical protein